MGDDDNYLSLALQLEVVQNPFKTTSVTTKCVVLIGMCTFVTIEQISLSFSSDLNIPLAAFYYGYIYHPTYPLSRNGAGFFVFTVLL